MNKLVKPLKINKLDLTTKIEINGKTGIILSLHCLIFFSVIMRPVMQTKMMTSFSKILRDFG